MYEKYFRGESMWFIEQIFLNVWTNSSVFNIKHQICMALPKKYSNWQQQKPPDIRKNIYIQNCRSNFS